MILQDVDDKYDKKNTLPFLANCKTRSLFWHLKNMADRGYGYMNIASGQHENGHGQRQFTYDNKVYAFSYIT